MINNVSLRHVRPIVTKVTIGSFVAAALLGILALLTGDLGSLQVRVLATTTLLGCVSLAVLSGLLVVDRPAWGVGVGALGAAGVAFITGVALIWWGEGAAHAWMGSAFRVFGVATTIALTCAQVSLLLTATRRGNRDIERLTLATVVAAALVAAMIIPLIVVDDFDVPDGYWRAFGVLAIMDALGTITLPAIVAFGVGRVKKADQSSPPAEQGQPTHVVVTLDADVTRSVQERAARFGSTPQEVANHLLRGALQDTSGGA